MQTPTDTSRGPMMADWAVAREGFRRSVFQAPAPLTPPRVRPLIASDIGPLMEAVGPLVDSLYTRGAEKMLRRLEDARDGYEIANVVVDGLGAPLALAAEAKKGRAARKLSTFWVAQHARRRGLGAMLLDQRIEDWSDSGIDTVHVTVRASRAQQLERLFLPRGFQRALIELDRYGSGGDEVVLRWSVSTGVRHVATMRAETSSSLVSQRFVA